MKYVAMLTLFLYLISTVSTQEIMDRKQGGCYNKVCCHKENKMLKKQNEELQKKIQELDEIIRNKETTLDELKKMYYSTCESSTKITMTTTSTSTSPTTLCRDPRWEAYLNSCYYVGTDSLTWSSALKTCNTMNSSLAVITTPEENEYVVSLVKSKGFSGKFGSIRGYWLGGTDYLNEGLWIWIATGTSITYENWDEGEPNNMGGTEHCLEIRTYKKYTWNDGYCTNSIKYVCEMTL